MARAMQLIGFAAVAWADVWPTARQLRGYSASQTSNPPAEVDNSTSLKSALQSAPYCATARVGKNSHGTNLRQASWSNVAEDCCNQCNGDSACHAWTWIEGSHECWLKSWVSDESQWADEDGVTSGLRSSQPPGPTPPSTCSGAVGKNSHGTNLRQAAWSNVAEDCCKQCNGDSACHAWTWIEGSHECWLKSWVPDESHWADEDGVTSGLRSSAPPSLASALQSAPYCATARVGKNSHGTNLRQASWSNVAEDCCNQCNGDSACHAWTWIEGSHECWLKSWVSDESQWADEDGVTSGLRSSQPPGPTPPSTCSGAVGKNSHGTNLRQAAWSNVAEDCCKQCNGDSACHAWTWIDGSHECWLKSWVPDESQWADEDGVISGLRS